MSNAEKKEKSPDSKRYTRILGGIALIVLAAVFAYFAVSQPNISTNTHTANGTFLQQTEATNAPVTENPTTENDPQSSSMQTEASVSSAPTQAPANAATTAPTQAPTNTATTAPTQAPTEAPTQASTNAPTQVPTNAPTEATEAKTTEPVISVQYPLNLNTCTAAELMTINGVGEARASAIIAYREYLGGYTDVEQLKNISGIGDGIFAKIEPYVTV